MIAMLGDIHGDSNVLERVDSQLPDECVAGIQVGDIGWYAENFNDFLGLKLKRPWYFIRGNHEKHEALLQYEEVAEVAPNLFYVPNGTVLNIDNRVIGFLGGAGSVDKDFNSRWSPLEQITDKEVDKFNEVEYLDVLVSHTPPQEIITAWFDPKMLVYMFGLPIDWKDPSAAKVQAVWEKFGKCQLYSGHMHRSIILPNARLLDINETFLYYPSAVEIK
jgi:calcineurin-like phosphoesterase family protein